MNLGIGIGSQIMAVEDAERVWQLDRQVFEFPWTVGHFRDSIEAGHGCFKWMLGDELVAYLVVRAVHDESHLLTLGVHKDFRGRGLGGDIVDKALTYASSKEAKSMFLEVRESNCHAMRLYESKGFVEVGRRAGYYSCSKGREDALLYAVSWEAFQKSSNPAMSTAEVV